VIVALYLKGKLDKRNGLFSVAGFAAVVLILFIYQKLCSPKTCPVKGKTD
jgi:hypothetical protein